MIKMIILDYDGVVVKNKKTELITRNFLKKFGFKNPPAIFFIISGLITGLISASSLINDDIKRFLEKNSFEKKYYIGILTDRNLFSVAKSLKKNSLSVFDFDFFQARKSFLNRFCGVNSLVGKLKNHWLTTISGIKPHPDTFKEIQRFAESKKIGKEEILIIDDISEIRDAIKNFGFFAVEPSFLAYFNPDLS